MRPMRPMRPNEANEANETNETNEANETNETNEALENRGVANLFDDYVLEKSRGRRNQIFHDDTSHGGL